MKEDIEVDLDSLNEKQLYNLLKLGEIDSCTYYECMQDLKKKKMTIFQRVKNQILKLISKKESRK
jgi:hypothetical protein